MQMLQQKNLSGGVTIPKEHLERDGVLEDGEFPEEQNLVVHGPYDRDIDGRGRA